MATERTEPMMLPEKDSRLPRRAMEPLPPLLPPLRSPKEVWPSPALPSSASNNPRGRGVNPQACRVGAGLGFIFRFFKP